MIHRYPTVPSALCDFNMVDSDDVLPILLAKVEGIAPGLGEPILLQDVDGNVCYGIVTNAAAPTFLDVRPIWESWRSAELRFTSTGGNAGLQPATATAAARRLTQVA